MRTSFLFGTILVFLLMGSDVLAQKANISSRAAYRQTEIDMGKLEQNKPKTVVFKVVSTGSDPVIINSVKASCGCTFVEYPEGPIEPGQEGEIKVTYDAKAVGSFRKTIVVRTNAMNATETKLEFFGWVAAPKTTD